MSCCVVSRLRMRFFLWFYLTIFTIFFSFFLTSWLLGDIQMQTRQDMLSFLLFFFPCFF